MGRDLRGLRVLVTGATSGIGRELAAQAVAAGMRVAVTGRRGDRLDELARDLGGRGEVFAHPADVTSEDDRAALVAAVVDRFGGLDVLVNNAGVASWGHFSTSCEDVMRKVLEVNFYAPAELMRLALPHLRDGRRPAIVNVASMCGRAAMPAWPEYSASKFALTGLAEALRAEFARFDVSVLTVLPGLTRSDLQRNMLRTDGKMRIDFEKGMPPAYVAGRVLDALRKDRAETVVGWDAWKMLTFQKFFPRLLDWLLARRVKQLYAASPAG